MTDDDPEDPYLEVLGWIATELSLIRVELQQSNTHLEDDQSSEQPDSRELFTCRSCDVPLEGERAARQHAVEEHGAPVDNWRELYG